MVIAQPDTSIPADEKITRMKPSEALRLGRLSHPQVSNRFRNEEGFCAVGLINYMRGDELFSVQSIDQDNKFQAVVLPCECTYVTVDSLGWVTVHLSDHHNYNNKPHSFRERLVGRIFGTDYPSYWSQGQIADWLESLGY